MFVAVHEMGSPCQKEIKCLFWDNMKYLLEIGIELDIYKKTR